MDLILHIGTEKSGSSSFQSWAALNRTALRDQGVFFSQALGERNHLMPYVWALGDFGRDDGFARLGLHSAQDYAQFRDTLPRILADEVEQARAAGCHSYVISNEHLHSRMVTDDHLRRLHALLSPHFARLRILCVLRPQVDMGISLLSTAARGHSPVTSAALNNIRPANSYFNFETMNGRWSTVFGPDTLTYLPYRRGPGLIAHVCDLVSVDATQFTQAPRENTALDAHSFAIVNTLHHLQPQVQQALRPYLNPVLEQLPMTLALRPSRAQAEVVQARFSELNDRLIQRRPDLQPDDLTPDWSRYPETSSLAPLDVTAPHDAQLARTLQGLACQAALSELRLWLARADCAELQKRTHPFRQALAQARRARDRFLTLDGTLPQDLAEHLTARLAQGDTADFQA